MLNALLTSETGRDKYGDQSCPVVGWESAQSEGPLAQQLKPGEESHCPRKAGQQQLPHLGLGLVRLVGPEFLGSAVQLLHLEPTSLWVSEGGEGWGERV